MLFNYYHPRVVLFVLFNRVSHYEMTDKADTQALILSVTADAESLDCQVPQMCRSLYG